MKIKLIKMARNCLKLIFEHFAKKMKKKCKNFIFFVSIYNRDLLLILREAQKWNISKLNFQKKI
jgi:hypothetical protein